MNPGHSYEKIVKYLFLTFVFFTCCLSAYCMLHNIKVYGYVHAYVLFSRPINAHPNYFALPVTTAIFGLNYLLFTAKRSLLFKLLCISGMVLLLFTLVRLTSRMASISLLIAIVYFFYLQKRNLNSKKSIAWVIAFTGLIICGFFTSNLGSVRITALLKKDYNINIQDNVRLRLYKVAYDVILMEPFSGHGVEFSQDVLNEKYDKLGYCHAYQYNYNTHNQFLQLAVNHGLWLGVLMLIMFLTPFLLNCYDSFFRPLSVLLILPFLTDCPLLDFRIVLFVLAIFLTYLLLNSSSKIEKLV